MPLLPHVLALMDCHAPAQPAFAHAPSGMHFLRHSASTGQDSTVYRPLMCLVLQAPRKSAPPAGPCAWVRGSRW